MKALTFWKTVVNDRSDFLDRALAALHEHGIRFCVIGGQAVNAYSDPVVSLDLHVVVAVDQVAEVDTVLAAEFEVERFPYSINVSAPDSNLRLQVQTDPRYFDFVERSQTRNVLGIDLPVADIADVLQGKVWAAMSPGRRPSKRLKDYADIARLVETEPELRASLPPEILERIA